MGQGGRDQGLGLDGLLLELDSEAGLDLLPDGVAEGEDVGCGGVAAIDESEGVAGRDSGVSQGEAFDETCPFEEPCGRKFDVAFGGGPVRNFSCGNLQIFGNLRQDRDRNERIFEEGACAAAIGFTFDDQHALAMADRPDSVEDIERSGRGVRAPVSEVALQIGVGKIGASGGIEAEGDGGDNVAMAVRGVEDTAAIREAALLAGEGDEGIGCGVFKAFKIESANGGNGAGNLLSIGPDVLDGCAADRAGDSGETFDSADSLLTDAEDEGVPFGPAGCDAVDGCTDASGCDGVIDSDADDQAIEALIADEEIAASAEDEDFEAVPSGILDGLEKIGLTRDFAEETGRTADVEGGVRGEGDLLLDADGGSLHGFETTTMRGSGEMLGTEG